MSQRNERKLWKLQYSGRLRALFAFLCVLAGFHAWNMLIFSKTQVRFRARSESDYRIRSYQSLSSAWFNCKQRSTLWEYGHDK